MACLLTTRHDRVVRSQAVEVQWSLHGVDFYDWQVWWAAAFGHGAFCCATVCSALSRVLSESDRQVDLSRRTRRERSMFASVCSVIVQMWAVAGIGDG